MLANSENKKLGRPPTKFGIYDKPRMLGRLSEDRWNHLKLAAAKTGQDFSEWAVALLEKEAKRLLDKRK